MGRLLEEISGRELAEWQAYLTRDGQISALIAKGTAPQLAHEMVWGPAHEDDDQDDP